MEEFPATWQSEWLRIRGEALRDERLQGWAAYYEQVQRELEGSPLCANT